MSGVVGHFLSTPHEPLRMLLVNYMLMRPEPCSSIRLDYESSRCIYLLGFQSNNELEVKNFNHSSVEHTKLSHAWNPVGPSTLFLFQHDQSCEVQNSYDREIWSFS